MPCARRDRERPRRARKEEKGRRARVSRAAKSMIFIIAPTDDGKLRVAAASGRQKMPSGVPCRRADDLHRLKTRNHAGLSNDASVAAQGVRRTRPKPCLRIWGGAAFPSHRPDDRRIDDASPPTGVAGLGRNRPRSDGWSPVLIALSRADEAASHDAIDGHHRATITLAFVTVAAWPRAERLRRYRAVRRAGFRLAEPGSRTMRRRFDRGRAEPDRSLLPFGYRWPFVSFSLHRTMSRRRASDLDRRGAPRNHRRTIISPRVCHALLAPASLQIIARLKSSASLRPFRVRAAPSRRSFGPPMPRGWSLRRI